MKPKEFRLGNLVHVDNHIAKVVSINDIGISIQLIERVVQSTNSGAKSPIPLTEEWLVKFGFVKIRKFWSNGILEFGNITTDKNFEFEFKFPHNHWYRSNTKYVHQLQNLYFALTGEELKLTYQ